MRSLESNSVIDGDHRNGDRRLVFQIREAEIALDEVASLGVRLDLKAEDQGDRVEGHCICSVMPETSAEAKA